MKKKHSRRHIYVFVVAPLVLSLVSLIAQILFWNYAYDNGEHAEHYFNTSAAIHELVAIESGFLALSTFGIAYSAIGIKELKESWKIAPLFAMILFAVTMPFYAFSVYEATGWFLF